MVSGWPLIVTVERQPFDIAWKQSEFGHPANSTESVVDFCIDVYLSVAIGIQEAPPIPYARQFSSVYKYKVTAKHDQVEVWEDLDGPDHLTHVYADYARPFKKHTRYLKKGESAIISIYGSAESFISGDLSSSGESIRRVKISSEPLSILGPPHPFKFANLEDVTITCVPRERDDLGALPEIPWEEDSPAFEIHEHMKKEH